MGITANNISLTMGSAFDFVLFDDSLRYCTASREYAGMNRPSHLELRTSLRRRPTLNQGKESYLVQVPAELDYKLFFL